MRDFEFSLNDERDSTASESRAAFVENMLNDELNVYRAENWVDYVSEAINSDENYEAMGKLLAAKKMDFEALGKLFFSAMEAHMTEKAVSKANKRSF